MFITNPEVGVLSTMLFTNTKVHFNHLFLIFSSNKLVHSVLFYWKWRNPHLPHLPATFGHLVYTPTPEVCRLNWGHCNPVLLFLLQVSLITIFIFFTTSPKQAFLSLPLWVIWLNSFCTWGTLSCLILVPWPLFFCCLTLKGHLSVRCLQVKNKINKPHNKLLRSPPVSWS